MADENMTISTVSMVDTGDVTNPDFPLDAEGRTFHLGVRKGEIANRVLTVGSLQRAEMFSKFLDTIEVSRVSARGFGTFTGTYQGVRISIVCSLMGYPNMDFMVRETRAVTDGPMVYLRFGTCGIIADHVPVGTYIVSRQCMLIQRDFDACNYRFSKYVDSDPTMVELLKKNLPEGSFVVGNTASADTFYGSQGRKEADFNDNNSTLVHDLQEQYPEIVNLEMEHFHLLHLAKMSKPNRKIVAAAAAIGIAQRKEGQMIGKAQEREMEKLAGVIMIKTIAEYPLENMLIANQ
jgi:uridine phosphorylase